MTEATFNLFAYGTLKPGGSGAHVLAGCEHIGRGSVRGILYEIDGEFPALVLYGGDRVDGEVWRCDWQLLSRLDEYEGVSKGQFRRVAVRAQTEQRGPIDCWTYVAGSKLTRKLTPSRRIAAWPAPQRTRRRS